MAHQTRRQRRLLLGRGAFGLRGVGGIRGAACRRRLFRRPGWRDRRKVGGIELAWNGHGEPRKVLGWLDVCGAPRAGCTNARRLWLRRRAARRIAGRIIPLPPPRRCTKKSALSGGSYDRFQGVSSSCRCSRIVSALRPEAMRMRSGSVLRAVKERYVGICGERWVTGFTRSSAGFAPKRQRNT